NALMQAYLPYNQFSYGGTLRLGYQITEALRQTLKYTLRQDTINNVSSTASRFIQEEAGTRNTSAVGQVLLYDKRDNRLDPTGGYFVQLSTDLAGLGGDVRYGRGVLSGGYYFGIAPNYVLSFTSETGYIEGIDDTVRIEDRFFVGGDNLRGFKVAGIGPRDPNTNDALGGNAYYIGSVSESFPLGLPQELGLSGHVFSDFGSLFGKNDQSPILDSHSLRVSAGMGFSWKSPLGPIRLDFAAPIVRESFDKSQYFRVNFGTRF
ncbi:MAG: BamA/TamA family outer membrane protein, partial [Stellaceae bacterium]